MNVVGNIPKLNLFIAAARACGKLLAGSNGA
jgi:hypothetical protein